MASKQDKALATQAPETGMAIPQETLDIYKEVGGAQVNMEYIDKPFFQLSIRASRFKIGDNVISETGKICANIMRVATVRAFYETKYDPNKPAPPDCGSVGGVTPDAHSEKKQAEHCARCPQNQWNTGTDATGKPGRGKACRESKRLVLHMDGIDLPVLLSLPPTSMKALDTYLKMISTMVPGGIPAFATICEFSFDPKSDFPKLEMTLKDIVRDPAQIKELFTLRNSPQYVAAEQAYATHEDFASESPTGTEGVDSEKKRDY